MKHLILRIFLISTFILFFSCTKTEEKIVEKTYYVYEGNIVNGFTCGYAFVSSASNEPFLPINLATNYQVNNLKVKIKFEDLGQTLFCPGFIGNAKKINIINIEIIP